MKRSARKRTSDTDEFMHAASASMGAMLGREEREDLASRMICGLLRGVFGEDTKSALQVLQRCAERYQRACERPLGTRRRIDALMRARPWIESQRDYERISRIVARAAIIGEAVLLPDEDAKLNRLGALIAAYDAGRVGDEVARTSRRDRHRPRPVKNQV